ncbi:MAG: hypothetical protein PUD24_06140 [Oscillospiraceae bacterium]|nr:hypothetical protein [Oscillospiraceae bacterium]
MFGNLKILYNESVLISYFSMSSREINAASLLTCVFIKPIIISAVLSEIEMTVSLFFKPIYAYLLSFVYIVISACCCHPALVLNYSIVCRVSDLSVFALKPTVMIAMSIAITAAAFIFGIIKIQKKDLL